MANNASVLITLPGLLVELADVVDMRRVLNRAGAQQSLALAALVEEMAGVRGHRFLLCMATMRTGQHGFENDGSNCGSL